jgi:uncharacterized coiled-coil protein SlyX
MISASQLGAINELSAALVGCTRARLQAQVDSLRSQLAAVEAELSDLPSNVRSQQ